MPYTLTGIIIPGKSIQVPPKPAPFATAPAQALPVGLSVWWRPVAVGFPNSGSSASAIGPSPYAPDRFVGTTSPEALRNYFPEYRTAKLLREVPMASMTAAFGPGHNMPMRESGEVVRRTWPGQTATIGGGSQVVLTTAGPMRLPRGVWLNPMSPAFMV